MSVAIADETRLALSLPVGGGPRKTIEVARRDLHPALMFAHRGERTEAEAKSYQRVADKLLLDDWWNPRQVYISSPAAGDGKTTTAFNLAWALSTRQKSVLLVELNFAKPRFRSVLGDLRIRYGIDGALHGSAKPEDSVFSLGDSGLYVSAVRDILDRRGIKRRMPSLNSFLSWATEKYEWLVLDCPPVLSPAWSGWFPEHAKPVLMVVRAHQTSLSQIRKAGQRLGSSLKGTLLNDVALADELKPETDDKNR
jgi:Mrp family chromosome partitioning ATPase